MIAIAMWFGQNIPLCTEREVITDAALKGGNSKEKKPDHFSMNINQTLKVYQRSFNLGEPRAYARSS